MRPFRILDRTIEMTADFAPGLEASYMWKAVNLDRAVRITLGSGAKWPPAVRRGQAVDLTFDVGNGQPVRIQGRVRFRRLDVAVIDGRVVLP